LKESSSKNSKKNSSSGIEICETQLLHLANKIKDVEVDHEIDNYLPAINNVLETYRKKS
jgi:ATP-dependent RNA helicase DeaD